MKRRTALKLTTLAAALSVAGLGAAQAQDVIRIGAAAPKTGGLAGGAEVTHWPAIRLWVEQTNAAGGLQLDSGPATIELIEYDDQTNPQQTIQAVTRLATQDQVDLILSPYGTGLNLAAAPIFDRLGYPQLSVTNITDQMPQLSQQFPNMFFTLGTTSAFAEDTVRLLAEMRDAGQVGNRVAMVNVADAFGIELATVARGVLAEEGFELVYDSSYPLGTQDLSTVVDGARNSNPDAFIAWSYPPDSFAITEQAMIQDFDVPFYYTAVGTPFPAYWGRFGEAANNILGPGGVNADDPRFQEFAAAHQELMGQGPDYWASATTYASMEILGQAIEDIGSVDRDAIAQHLRENTYDTVLGPISFNENNNNEAFWTVGQWQDGVFRGVASRGREGAVEVRLKEGWD
ncbi:amino acid ABC transporter substrate-binding protein [Alkalilacustris brevis]|uniref:amino acid ABC transporter substrate-binding protein n=1 Tax=Alkalilacustris brevis TaxID=2026338 RepID=UPI000E0D5643|nr:amino acid ABC transporter substrate-binding protein [Alkalilacustris brevis]